jgi:hypothetical protein
MSTRSLRARLERLQARAGEHYVIGQDWDRDRNRRQQLHRLKLNPGLTEAQTAELVALENEDRVSSRAWQLLFKRFETGLTDAERAEYAELQGYFPIDPDKIAELFDLGAAEQ